MRSVGIDLNRWTVRLHGGETRYVYGTDPATALMLAGIDEAEVWAITGEDEG